VRRTLAKSAQHHWWPRGLSKQWADNNGAVTRLGADGTISTAPPANFGSIGNAHRIGRTEDSPWNASFESSFGDADSSFPELAIWLNSLDKSNDAPKELHRRILAQPLSKVRRQQLSEGIASLVVRSPRSRNNVKILIESAFETKPPENYVDKTLIAANLANNLPLFTRAINGGGKFAILTSARREFIFGDGFLHNFPVGNSHPIAPRLLLPILPSIAVLFFQPLRYRVEPQLVTVALKSKEIEFVNRTTQIYSCNEIFYRNDKPKLLEEFRQQQFLEYEYHYHPWLDYVASEVLNCSS
jgi:hypothetical protein